ncbi:MAG: ribosomal RNA small subunit methyltransferase A [Synergistes sp.]|nr:ribosomal RNA small subunit methyltransferase A [Synergistes sp.]
MAGKRHFVHNTDIGQNFLIDRSVVEFIVERSAPGRGDAVLEIGPGDGVLTRGLLTTPLKELYVIEVDERLREGIERITERDGRCAAFWGDAVRFDYEAALPEPPTKIIANLPYHITTPLMWTFLEKLVPAQVDYMMLMVQRESAERIASPAGHRERSPLGVTIEAMGSAEIVRKVPPSAFNPRPKVESALIEIKIEREKNLANDRTWRGLLSRSFAQRRKTLVNNWTTGYAGSGMTRERALDILSETDLRPTARAEELPLEKWFKLAEVPEFRIKKALPFG